MTVVQQLVEQGGEAARVRLRWAQFEVGFAFAMLVCT